MIFVGDVSTEKAHEISALARRFGVEERVVMAGPVAYAELPAVYHHAAANILPPRARTVQISCWRQWDRAPAALRT
jgi:glycosyltransferase involved in cell wall biosynthesis